MKNSLPGLTALFIFILLFACSNSDDDAANMGSDNCMIRCKVDGVQYEADPANNCAFLGNTLNIGQTGMNAIQLQVNGLTAPGTYSLGGQDAVVIIQLSDGTTIGGLSGQVEVTEISNGQAEGTFSGSFYVVTDPSQTPTHTVTEGVFSASF